MTQLDIDGMFNTRALGDPAWLVRTGAPERVTPEGAAALRGLGASIAVDLREPDEAGPVAHGLPVRSVPIYGRPAPLTGRLEEIYERLLRERGAALAEAVGAIVDADGAAVVHCTAGKDRTGLVVALALAASGASAEEIEADYALSGANVRPVRERAALAIADGLESADRAEILRLHLDSPVAAVRHALDVIADLGGAAAYLAGHGLSPAQIEGLRAKRVGRIGAPA
ncbi:tyrosine-protein phosphatase [Microbacterium halophytorum]|uniref:tyrosine-protein phosphatase n=1 Tax=Microbacterium halophytorum TaxID=2067568 RepID=UPI000CFC667B|nr:tyrosine-protein phosphatase [Microbacterium halophytorum]